MTQGDMQKACIAGPLPWLICFLLTSHPFQKKPQTASRFHFQPVLNLGCRHFEFRRTQ